MLKTIAIYLPVLACGAMMLLICIPMMRKMHGGDHADDAASREEVAKLREEVARLKAGRIVADERERVDG